MLLQIKNEQYRTVPDGYVPNSLFILLIYGLVFLWYFYNSRF